MRKHIGEPVPHNGVEIGDPYMKFRKPRNVIPQVRKHYIGEPIPKNDVEIGDPYIDFKKDRRIGDPKPIDVGDPRPRRITSRVR